MKSFFLQLVVSPPVVSTGTFVMVIRMLAIMCGSCPDLAVVLLRQSKHCSYVHTRPLSKSQILRLVHNSHRETLEL